MTFFRKNKISGLTLIETLIYSALITILISAALVSTYRIIDSSNNTQRMVTIEEEANFILRKMEWALTGIDAINSPAPSSSASALSLNKYNFSQNPIVFDLGSGSVRIKKGSNPSTILNSRNVLVENLNFEHISANGNIPEGIKISFKINSKNFGTTIYLRK